MMMRNCFLQDMDKIKAKYICFGIEYAPTTGTSHLQGYIQLKNCTSFNQVINLLPVGIHIEPFRGSDQQNFNYCSKENEDFIEVGKRLAV